MLVSQPVCQPVGQMSDCSQNVGETKELNIGRVFTEQRTLPEELVVKGQQQ